MKISTLLTIAILTVSGIAVVQSGSSALLAFNNSQTVQTMRQLVAMRGLWFEELTSLSLERSLGQVQLSMAPGTDAAVANLRQTQHENSVAKFAEIKEGLSAIEGFPMRDELRDDTEAALPAIADDHKVIDELVKKPLSQRDHAMGEAAIEGIKSEIVEMRGMAVHIVVPNELTSTEVMLLMRLQETVFDAREYAGRARSMFAIATLHQRTLSLSELTYVDNNLTRATEAWQAIEHISETITIPPAVTQDIAATQAIFQEYLALLEKLQGEMLSATIEAKADAEAEDTGAIVSSAVGIPITYSISFDDYFKQSGDALAKLSGLIRTISLSLDEKWLARDTTQQNTMIWNIFVLLGTLGITVATLWQVSTKITHRIIVKVDELAALTKGEINHTLTQDRRDLHEIKAITRGLEDLQSQLQTAASAKEALQLSEAAQQQVVQSLTNGLNQLAAGDLTARIAERFDPKYQGLADNFNVAATALSDLVARVIETANGILSGARGISEATTELSQRTETQGVTLQNAAAALEELTRNIIGSQSDATELDGLASLASDKGVAMGVTMAKSVSAIEAIKSSSQQIEQIVGVIEDIAFQTNLLALNAGVEATRAGAEGSGFAVIASEVRGLAERSAQSAQDIKSLIAASGLEVAKGVEYVAEAEASAGDIGAHIQKISGIISRIAVAASEQSQGLVKVNDGVSKLDLVTQTNVAMVEETTAECASLTAVAQDLSQLVSHFQIAQSKAGGFHFPAQAA